MAPLLPGPGAASIQELSAVACLSRASVSARAGVALSRSKISRACWRPGAASGPRESPIRHRPWPKEGERLLGDDPEPLPAIGGIGVGIGGCLKLPSGLRDGGVRRDEGVLGKWVAGLNTGHQTFGERGGIDP